MMEALQFEFMQNALTAGLLASFICGIIGSLVIVNRITFLSGGIAHAAYGGIGLSIYMGWPILLGTLGFSFTAAMIMAAITIGTRHRADAVIGVIWAVGMATGIILIDRTPGYHADLMSYLFGSILSVPQTDIRIMLGLGIVILLVITLYYNELLALSYDEEFARVRGVPVRPLYFLMIGLLSVAIVMMIQVVGLILVIALLTIPPLIMEPYAKSLTQMMVGAGIAGAIFTACGLWVSYEFNLTAGASIILIAGIVYFISLVVHRLGAAGLPGRLVRSRSAPQRSGPMR